MPDGFAVTVTLGKLKHRSPVRGNNRLDEYFGGGNKKERNYRLLAGFKGFKVFRAEHFKAAFGDERRSKRTFDTRSYLFPITKSVIQANSAIKDTDQNPGWE